MTWTDFTWEHGWTTAVIPATDGRPDRGNEVNFTAGANGEIDLWDTHITFEIDGSDIDVTITSLCTGQLRPESKRHQLYPDGRRLFHGVRQQHRQLPHH